jgi:hypothetical protein
MSTPANTPSSAGGTGATIETLRSRHQVRLIEPTEEGCALNGLPAGVYGFAYAPGHDEVPVFAKKSYHSFEVHKAADGSEYLIGFVTPQEASDLEASRAGASIRLFPDSWQTSQILVSAPLARMIPPKRMPREDGNQFPFTIA